MRMVFLKWFEEWGLGVWFHNQFKNVFVVRMKDCALDKFH